jgi:hypothetical protein
MAHELKSVTGGMDPGEIGKMFGLDGD